MMARKKIFKATRSPRYLVVTACKPEDLDGVTLKVRDLHTIHQVMLDYSTRYIKAMDDEHQRCGEALDLHAMPGTATRSLENLIRIMFTAYLSAYASIMYYLKEAFDDDGRLWLERRRADAEALAALDRLRNMEIHHEPLHKLIGLRQRFLGASAPYSSIESREVHQHMSLLPEGIGFYPLALSELRQFESQPGLVEFLTYNSILELTHVCIHEIRDLINEAAQKAYLAPLERSLTCSICPPVEEA
jgi:hypothetical protein